VCVFFISSMHATFPSISYCLIDIIIFWEDKTLSSSSLCSFLHPHPISSKTHVLYFQHTQSACVCEVPRFHAYPL
jgi:hypothetical protein